MGKIIQTAGSDPVHNTSVKMGEKVGNTFSDGVNLE